GVGGDITGAGASGRPRVDRHRRDAGAGETAAPDGIGPAAGGEADLLDTAGVHRDAGDVAGEAQALPVGAEVDLLRNVRAIEFQGVSAALAFHHVAPVARIPEEDVIALAEQGHVVASPAVDQV